MAPLPRLAATLPIALLLLAGCGDDKKAGTGSTSPSASPSPSVSPSLDDAAVAAAINLKAADLGPGWTVSPADADSKALEVEVEKNAYACLGKPPVDPAGDDISSEEFADANGSEISSSVDLYATAEAAKSELQDTTSDKGLACFRTAFKAGLDKQAAGSAGTVSDLQVVARKELQVLADSAAFRVTAKLQVQGRSVTFIGDVVTFVRGRAGVSVTTFSMGGPPVPDATLLEAARTVEARAAANV